MTASTTSKTNLNKRKRNVLVLYAKVDKEVRDKPNESELLIEGSTIAANISATHQGGICEQRSQQGKQGVQPNRRKVKQASLMIFGCVSYSDTRRIIVGIVHYAKQW